MFKPKILAFVVGAFLSFGLCKNGVAAALCDPNCTEPDFFVHGLCFSPYKDGQAPPDYVSPEQIRERLAIITRKKHTDWIRTYSATNGLEKIPAEANSLYLQVAMGTWIRHNVVEEVNNLVANAQEGLVDIAVVGNEELYAYEHNHDDALTPPEFLSVLVYVRQRLDDANCSNVPIAAAEPFGTLFTIDGRGHCTVRYPQLINAVDIVLVNIYPFHKGVHIDIALADLALRYQCAVDAVRNIDPNKQVIIGETGWASDGLTKIDAEPSLENLARYFLESSAWAQDNNVPMFYFSAFDENWKELPPAGPTPFLTESHWGIWDSNGVLKHTFATEPVLCETFDEPSINPLYAENHHESNAPEPNVLAADPDSDGNFLRLLYDGNGLTHYSYVAFDRVAVGLYSQIEVQFDFRLHGPDDQNDADGFAFMLIPTLLNGIRGSSNHLHYAGFFAEEPKLPKVFAIGFEVWEYPPGQLCDRLYISWDSEWFPDGEPIDVSVDLDNGAFHRAILELRASGSDSLVTLAIDPNIYEPDGGDPCVVVQNLRIEGLRPYENRVQFIGRSGWHDRDINVDIDNIKVAYKPQICDCVLPADLNQDCEVNFEDVAILASDWLRTCDSNTADECFPTSHPDYAN